MIIRYYKSYSHCISIAWIYLTFLGRCWIQELDIAIVKATNHVERPAKEKHIRGVFSDALLKIVLILSDWMSLHMFFIWTSHFYLIMCFFYLMLYDYITRNIKTRWFWTYLQLYSRLSQLPGLGLMLHIAFMLWQEDYQRRIIGQ